jgi:phosphoribosyl 1,2-cyclic phosphodiesterase
VCPDDGTNLIIDAGTGIRRLGQELMTGPFGAGAGTVHLLISHTHWDHIQGIPFFAPLYVKGNRINVYARQRDVHLKTIFSSQTEDPYFPISLDEVAADINYNALVDGQTFSIGGVQARCARLNHPFIAIGYRLDADGGSLAYISDTAPFDRILFGHQFISRRPDPDAAPSEKEIAELRAIRDGVVRLCRGCDLVIYDTMFRMKEYLARPHWGHSSPEHAIDVVREAGARCLALYHHAPDRRDEEVTRDQEQAQRLAYSRGGSGVQVLAAAEGSVLELGDGVRRVG